MTYFTRKSYKGKSIQGYVEIPYGSLLEYKDQLLYYKNKPVCYISSQNGLDYFVSNHDDRGKERAYLITWILEHTKKGSCRYDDIWNMIWNKSVYHVFKRPEYNNVWIWYIQFFSSPIDLLENLKYDIEQIEKSER